MIIKIKPIEIDSQTADELLIELHEHTITETSCNVYYHLRDSKQTTAVQDKELPYKVLKFQILKVEGKEFEKIKEDENNLIDYIINKLNLEKL